MLRQVHQFCWLPFCDEKLRLPEFDCIYYTRIGGFAKNLMLPLNGLVHGNILGDFEINIQEATLCNYGLKVCDEELAI